MSEEQKGENTHDAPGWRRGRLGSRWLKFNAVGALGIPVQLAAFFAFKTIFHLGYMLSTALAVETAVLHNFLWHERYTWADRVHPGQKPVRRLVRFNLTTGAVSIGGNLAIMRALVGMAGVNDMIANGISIALCSLVNFLVSDAWVFAHQSKHPRSLAPRHE